MHTLVLTIGCLLAVMPPQDPRARVHDLAHILSPSQQAELERMARDVEKETTAQLAVVTVPSLESHTVETYAHQLFNQWGIGQRDKNNGVLLLVAPNERRMRIEVGYGLEPLLTDALCGEIRDGAIIPRFKAHDYPGGILAGVQQIASILKDHPEAARGVPGAAPAFVRTPRRDAVGAAGLTATLAAVFAALGAWIKSRRLYSSVTFLVVSGVTLSVLGLAAFLAWRTPEAQRPWLWFGGASLASVAAWFYNWRKYSRFGPHGCSKCGTRLELLSELDEDPKLTAVQQLEEQIGSVDYDVWVCPACLNTDTKRYIMPFSHFSTCPNCKARTYTEDPQKTIYGATTTRAGLARIEGRCVSCKHKTVKDVVLPIIVVSNNSWGSSSSSGGGGWSGGGGGSFGGGSSGGGGASGGW